MVDLTLSYSHLCGLPLRYHNGRTSIKTSLLRIRFDICLPVGGGGKADPSEEQRRPYCYRSRLQATGVVSFSALLTSTPTHFHLLTRETQVKNLLSDHTHSILFHTSKFEIH